MLESALTIRALTARAVAAPLARPLRTASGDIPVSPLLLVDVASEEGPVGRAYVFGYTTLTLRALKAFLEDVEEVVRGRAASPARRRSIFLRACMTLRFRLTDGFSKCWRFLSSVRMPSFSHFRLKRRSAFSKLSSSRTCTTGMK